MKSLVECSVAEQQPQALMQSCVMGAQYLTLVFIGCISVSSLRAFLRNMHQACHAVAGLAHAPEPHLLCWHHWALPPETSRRPARIMSRVDGLLRRHRDLHGAQHEGEPGCMGAHSLYIKVAQLYIAASCNSTINASASGACCAALLYACRT